MGFGACAPGIEIRARIGLTTEQVTRLLALRSESMGISKTHAQLHVATDGSLVVTDRGSTNGSTLTRKGVSRQLSPGNRSPAKNSST